MTASAAAAAAAAAVPEPPVIDARFSASEVTGIVSLFNGMLWAMEGRLIAKMDENSRLAIERWVKHDLDTDRSHALTVARFILIEASILKTETYLATRISKEHDEELAARERVKPVIMSVQYVTRNWKTIALVAFTLLSLAGLVDQMVVRLLL